MVKRFLTPDEMEDRKSQGEEGGWDIENGDTLITTYSPDGEIIEEQIEVDMDIKWMGITREQFQAFVDVQLSGVTNMMDTRTVAKETDGVLTKEDVRNIIIHYNTLLTQYPDIKETVYAQG